MLKLKELNKFLMFPALDKPHLEYQDIEPIIEQLKRVPIIRHKLIGYSFEKRPINLFSVGTGATVILAWSQMHGDEPTATASILDTLALITEQHSIVPERLLTRVTIHFIPMLNPDGAAIHTRQNAQAIDINRDAQSLQTPEGRLLKKVVNELKPDIALNLHDQSTNYQCGDTKNPSTLAFLAPAFNTQKEIDDSRLQAMNIIGHLAKLTHKAIPDKVAKYDDTFAKRCFGDYIAGLGISTILIESGAHSRDPNRQIARALNTQCILETMRLCVKDSSDKADANISNDRYHDSESRPIDQHFDPVEYYHQLPSNNAKQLCSLLIKKLSFAHYSYLADVAIVQPLKHLPELIIDSVGDLGSMGGLEEFDGTHYSYQSGNPYLLRKTLILNKEAYFEILHQGYSHFVGDPQLLLNQSEMPVLLNPQYFHSNRALALGHAAYGLLESKNHSLKALLNGTIISIPDTTEHL